MKSRTKRRTKWALGVAYLVATLLGSGACGNDGDEQRVRRGPVLFEEISGAEWDETAVRKVLHVFAFGGFSSDEQIKIWADMEPHFAVQEMITLGDFNAKISPVSPDLPAGGLRELARHWSGSSSPLPSDERERYEVGSWSSPSFAWFLAASKSGANPVRQKIGLIETNYHLAVNQDAGVNNWQMFRYYDSVMDALAASTPYTEVLSTAAESAAVATQYNHKDNRFVDGLFEGNEDFGREIHQLYFGILGVEDPEYHEVTTIRNTSKALTDMKLERVGEGDDEHDDEVVTFGTAEHYPSALEIHKSQVDGETAREKIAGIVALNMEHPETADNLPVIIIRTLADDNLTDDKIAAIRAAWKAQPTKDLLDFLRSYAMSTTFHDESRVKYWTTIDRNLIANNRATLTTEEAYAGFYNSRYMVSREDVEVFRPVNNVFGGQTGLMAANSGSVFREAYNNSTERYWTHARVDDEDTGWEKNWAAVIPTMDDGRRHVKETAEWLWQRFIADGLKNFGTLERAQVYSLIVAGVDFALFVDDTKPAAVYSAADIETNVTLNERYTDMGVAIVPLDSSDSDERQTANRRIGLAINFVLATPYAFAQEGN